jgi:hypothetical protein
MSAYPVATFANPLATPMQVVGEVALVTARPVADVLDEEPVRAEGQRVHESEVAPRGRAEVEQRGSSVERASSVDADLPTLEALPAARNGVIQPRAREQPGSFDPVRAGVSDHSVVRLGHGVHARLDQLDAGGREHVPRELLEPRPRRERPVLEAVER